MTNKENLAYLSGLIDGEGSIDLKKYTNQKGCYARVRVVNTDKNMIRWIKNNFSGNLNQTYRKKHGYFQYTWVVYSRNAFKILKKVYNYLITKKRHAELIFEFYKTGDYRGKHTPIEIKNKREEIYNKIRKLNRKKGFSKSPIY